MPEVSTRLGRCPICARIFVIPPEAQVALCDRLLCDGAKIKPLSRKEISTLPADFRPEPALPAKVRYLLGLFEDLDDERQVFLCRATHPGFYTVIFKNQGRKVEVILSGEAIEALHRLYQRHIKDLQQ